MVALFSGLIASFVVVGALIPWLRTRFVDVPNLRSSHAKPVPRGGGLGVLISIAASATVLQGDSAVSMALVASVIALAGVGLVDDARSLASGPRMAAQTAVSLTLSIVLLWVEGESWWWLVLLPLGLIAFVNAFNFMDGINGISGLTATVMGAWWAWVGYDQDLEVLAGLGLLLAGAALGFLPWNVPRARVFLGDVGSYGLGLYAGGLSALAVLQGVPVSWCLAPLAIYCADTGWVLVKRARERKPLTEAHREHVYQRLVDNGWSHGASSILCVSATGLLCLLAAGTQGSIIWWAGGLPMIVLFYLLLPGRVSRSVAS